MQNTRLNPGCITDLCTPDKPPKTAPTEQCKGCFDKLQPNLQSILNTGGGVGLTFAFTMVGHHCCCCKLLFKLLLSSSSSSILFVLLLIALACLDCGCQFLGIWAAHTYRYVSMRACVCGRQRKREGLQHTQTHRHTDTHRHVHFHARPVAPRSTLCSRGLPLMRRRSCTCRFRLQTAWPASRHKTPSTATLLLETVRFQKRERVCV